MEEGEGVVFVSSVFTTYNIGFMVKSWSSFKISFLLRHNQARGAASLQLAVNFFQKFNLRLRLFGGRAFGGFFDAF